jgi:hypothetical protein
MGINNDYEGEIWKQNLMNAINQRADIQTNYLYFVSNAHSLYLFAEQRRYK